MNLQKIGHALIAAGAVLSDLTIELDEVGKSAQPKKPNEPQTSVVESADESEANKMKVPELKQALLAKGFKEDDFKGMKKAELVQMLEQGIPMNEEEETEEPATETKKEEEITGDMFDAPAKKEDLPAIDEATLRTKMVEFAKATDKEKAFSMLAKFDGATSIAQLKPEQRAECYKLIEDELASA